MSIFGKIMGAIFGTKAEGGTRLAAGAAAGRQQRARGSAGARKSLSMSHPSSTRLSKPEGEKLEWRTSIVDLMKALDINSSFTGTQGARQGTRLHRRQQ